MNDGDTVRIDGEKVRCAHPRGYLEEPTGFDEDPLDDVLGGDMRRKAILVGVALVLAALSFFVLGEIASSTDTYAASIEALDAKKDTVMGLVAASAAASTAISLLPGDAGTPIAQKLMDLSSDFLVVITAIYLEKYLLTILGFAAFKVLVPIGCALFIAAVLIRRNFAMKKAIAGVAAKMALFGIAIAFVVPVSLWVSEMIENTYQASIDETIATAHQAAEQAEGAQADDSQDGGSAQGSAKEDESEGSFLDVLKPVADAAAAVTSLASDAIEQAQKALSGFIEALAVMIVTSCVIPILVLIFSLWLVRVLLGVNIDVPMQMLRPRTMRPIRK